MTIFMDAPRPVKFRRFKTSCHLFSSFPGAFGTSELVRFALSIGLKVEWIQHKGTYKEHFDLFGGRIKVAKKHGVKEVGKREAVQLWKLKREAMRCS